MRSTPQARPEWAESMDVPFMHPTAMQALPPLGVWPLAIELWPSGSSTLESSELCARSEARFSRLLIVCRQCLACTDLGLGLLDLLKQAWSGWNPTGHCGVRVSGCQVTLM